MTTAEDPQVDIVARNLARQTQWYGEPLGTRFRRLLGQLGLSQAGLAETLGLSAPMLSQLMSGRRAKISNPAVQARLLAVEGYVASAEFATATEAERRARLAAIRAENGSASTGEMVRAGTPYLADPATALQALLRAVASAREIDEAAELLAPRLPELAELLRVYGNGRAADAREHFARTLGGSR